MAFEVRPLALPEVLEITPRRHEDSRGYFAETYNYRDFSALGIAVEFVQDNQSFSKKKGVLRGLHYQLPPKAQDKLVRVLRGAILDVAVDLRRSSPAFGKWTSLELSAARGNMIFVPAGFAHGFLTLEDDTEVAYKVSDYYSPEYDRSLRYDDPDVAIEWRLGDEPQLSDKDRSAPLLSAATTFG